MNADVASAADSENHEAPPRLALPGPWHLTASGPAFCAVALHVVPDRHQVFIVASKFFPMAVNWTLAQQKAARTARWAVTMTKVRIRRVASRTHWQLVTFCGKAGGESVGVVDLLAVRKDHSKPGRSMKRGDALQLLLIQVKGGGAAMPTEDDAIRLRAVAKRHRANRVLLASWKKGRAARFFRLARGSARWIELTDLDAIFR